MHFLPLGMALLMFCSPILSDSLEIPTDDSDIISDYLASAQPYTEISAAEGAEPNVAGSENPGGLGVKSTNEDFSAFNIFVNTNTPENPENTLVNVDPDPNNADSKMAAPSAAASCLDDPIIGETTENTKKKPRGLLWCPLDGTLHPPPQRQSPSPSPSPPPSPPPSPGVAPAAPILKPVDARIRRPDIDGGTEYGDPRNCLMHPEQSYNTVICGGPPTGTVLMALLVRDCWRCMSLFFSHNSISYQLSNIVFS